MKIKKSKEIMEAFEKTYSNFLKYLQGDKFAHIHKYGNYDLALPDVIEEMKLAYKVNCGVEPRLERTPSDLFEKIKFNGDISFKLLTQVETNKNLKKRVIKKNILIPMDYTKIVDKNFNTYIPYGYYTDNIILPVVVSGNNEWITPNEMEYNTMKPSIDKAFGDVAVFGLGIGFYAYEIGLKENVKSITIIEFDEEIIENFNKLIYPLFPQNIKDKIKIIHGNAFDYLNRDFMDNFDYGFIDIWLNNSDGLEIYKEILKKDFDINKVDFWIENQFFIDIQLYLFTYFTHYFRGSLTEACLGNEDIPVWLKHINRTIKSLDREDIVTTESFLNLLQDKELIRLLLKTKK